MRARTKAVQLGLFALLVVVPFGIWFVLHRASDPTSSARGGDDSTRTNVARDPARASSEKARVELEAEADNLQRKAPLHAEALDPAIADEQQDPRLAKAEWRRATRLERLQRNFKEFEAAVRDAPGKAPHLAERILLADAVLQLDSRGQFVDVAPGTKSPVDVQSSGQITYFNCERRYAIDLAVFEDLAAVHELNSADRPVDAASGGIPALPRLSSAQQVRVNEAYGRALSQLTDSR